MYDRIGGQKLITVKITNILHFIQMAEDRLNGLALMAIHKEIKLDYETILNLCCVEYDTRLKLVT